MIHNRDPKLIHETVLRDIVTLISSGYRQYDDYGELAIWGRHSKHSFRSISKATSNLILTFPILASDQVDLEAAIMLCKSHERKCAAMMHMLFSALSYSSDSENVYDYLKQFHKNIDFDEDDLNIDNFNSTMDDIADAAEESATPIYQSKQFNMQYLNEIQRDMRNLDFVREISINPPIGSLWDKYDIVQEARNRSNIPPKVPDSGWNAMSQQERDAYSAAMRTYKRDTNATIDKLTDERNNYKDQLKNQPKGSTTTTKVNEYPWQKNYADRMAGMEKAHKMAQDPWVKTDIQKANELLPTMLVINFYTPNTNEPITAAIGIKAKVYQIPSDQIMARLLVRNRDNQGFLNFLRATTRETSFIKDFALAVDKAKIDALSSTHRGSDSKIWRLLEKRAIKSKIRRGLGMKNDATAITTVAITQNEVETMKKEYNTDIMRVPVLKPIMDAYNLMGFVAIDSEIEAMKFLYDDGSNSFDTLSFSSLERDAKDNGYKKVINLMTKMVR